MTAVLRPDAGGPRALAQVDSGAFPSSHFRVYAAAPWATLTGGPICALEHLIALMPFCDEIGLFLCHQGPLEERARKANVPTYGFPFVFRGLRRCSPRRFVGGIAAVLRSRWAYVRGVCRILKDQPGVLHIHCRAAHLPYALLAGRLAGVPVVVSIHEPWAGGFEAWTELWMIRLLARHVIFPGHHMAMSHPAFMRRHFSVSHYHMALPPTSRADGPAGKPLRVVMPAVMDHRKGVDVFLQTCLLLRQMGVDFQAWAVGGWASELVRQQAREFLARNQLENVFKDCGVVEDMSAIYAQTDILLLTSRRDPLPRVVMEAMCHGLPVVATRVDGVPELVEDGVSGLLAESENASGLAEAVARLIRDDELRRRMGRAGRERAAVLFSSDAYARRMLGLYETLIPVPPPR